MHNTTLLTVPRLSSMTSTSSRSSSVTSSTSELSDSSLSHASIQTLTECLHRIHGLGDEGQNDEELGLLLLEALGLVALLKKEHINDMPNSVQNRAHTILQDQQKTKAIKANTQVAFLFGRCFNLSMNSKILRQCQFADSEIASRVLADFEVLEMSIKAKLSPCDVNGLDQQLSSLQFS